MFGNDIGSHLKQSENLRAGSDKEKEESHKLLLKLLKQVQELHAVIFKIQTLFTSISKNSKGMLELVEI